MIGMAERLQPRTAAFRVKFEDVGVAMAPGGGTADVHLTAEFIRRNLTTGEETLDAREFMIGMRRVGSEWQIARVTAVDTLEKSDRLQADRRRPVEASPRPLRIIERPSRAGEAR